jgi:hypothetical protein
MMIVANNEGRFTYFVQKDGIRVEFSHLTKADADAMYTIVKKYGYTVHKLGDDPHEAHGYEPEWRMA